MINTIQEGVVFNLADKAEFKEGGFRPLVIDSNDKAGGACAYGGGRGSAYS